MAFTPAGSLVPYGGPVLRSHIINNSVTITDMDSVKVGTTGFVALGTAGKSVFGHVSGIRTNKGVGLNTTGAAGSEIGSFVGTFTTASDNTTVAQVRAEIDISQFTVYNSGTPAAGTFGTTTANSGLLAQKFGLASEDSIDETSTVVTTAQYFSYGKVTGQNAITMTIFESQVFNDSQT